MSWGYQRIKLINDQTTHSYSLGQDLSIKTHIDDVLMFPKNVTKSGCLILHHKNRDKQAIFGFTVTVIYGFTSPPRFMSVWRQRWDGLKFVGSFMEPKLYRELTLYVTATNPFGQL
jgi:hypothetical protein